MLHMSVVGSVWTCRGTYRQWIGPPQQEQCQTASPSCLYWQAGGQPWGHGNWGDSLAN